MSFPLDLAMFSLLLFRVPVEYDYHVYEVGVPQFNKNEYQNDTLLFESYADMPQHINGNLIETQIGISSISEEINQESSLYFYRLSTMATDENGYLKENYSPLYVSRSKVDTSSFVNASYQELFKIVFKLHAPQDLFIDFVVAESFGSSVQTHWFLNNVEGRKSHFYDYYYVFNVDYGFYYEVNEQIVSHDNSNWYSINLKSLYNTNVQNQQEYFSVNIANLKTHLPNHTGYGALQQINNYICFKNDSNFSQVSYDSGYIDGYNVGKNETVDQSLWIYSFTRSVFNGFAQVLNVDILPNIKLGYLIAIPLVLSVLRFILGFFKGD